jgi:hypothetical protein
MDHSFSDPDRAQKIFGISSVIMGVLGLTALVVPSTLAVAMGAVSKDLYGQGHRGTQRDYGRLGVRLGYVGFALTGVAIVLFAASEVLS